MAASLTTRFQDHEWVGDVAPEEDLAEVFAGAPDFDAVFAVLGRRALEQGWAGLLCRHLLDAGGHPVSQERRAGPRALVELLDDPTFRRRWPIEARTLALARPLAWTMSAWPGDQGLAARAAMERLAEAGLADGGAALAVRGPAGRSTLLVLFSRAGVAANAADAWLVAGAHAHARLCELLFVADAPPKLSRREREILRLAAGGRPAAAVAGELGVTEATVKFHLASVRKKLRVRSTAHALAKLRVMRASLW